MDDGVKLLFRMYSDYPARVATKLKILRVAAGRTFRPDR